MEANIHRINDLHRKRSNSEFQANHLIRERKPKPISSYFSIDSVSNAPRDTVEAYVAEQLDHHKMADPNLQDRLEKYRISFPEVDLSRMQKTSHGVFWYDLHLFFVHRERWNEVRHTVLDRVQSMMLAVANRTLQRFQFAVFSDYQRRLAFIGGYKTICAVTRNPGL